VNWDLELNDLCRFIFYIIIVVSKNHLNIRLGFDFIK
jgi:hypothetical protein